MNKYRAKIYRIIDGRIKAAILPVNADSIDEARHCVKEIAGKFSDKLTFNEIPDNIEIEQVG